MAYFNTNKPKPLSELVKGFLDDVPYKKKLKRAMVVSFWAETVGSQINAETENVHFEHGNLVVHVKNSAWRHEIHMKRFSIAKRLNDKVGGNIVKEIIVRY